MKRTKRILITSAAGIAVASAAYLALNHQPASQQSVDVLPKKVSASVETPILTTLTPSDLPAVCEADPVLQSAITKWCDAARTGGALTEADRSELHRAIASSTLDPSSLLAIADCIKRYAKAETLVAGLLAQRASEVVLAEPHSDDPAQFARRVRLLMEIKKTFWYCIDKSDRRLVASQLKVCEVLSRVRANQEPELEEARVSSVIGAAECLYLLGSSEDALARLDSLSNKARLTKRQTVSVAWARALALCALDRYSEAIPQLEYCASENGFDHQVDSLGMLTLANIRDGQLDAAERHLSQLGEKSPQNAILLRAMDELRRERLKVAHNP